MGKDPCDVRFWHLADIHFDAEHVHLWAQSGPPLIPSPMSANDPKQTTRKQTTLMAHSGPRTAKIVEADPDTAPRVAF
jgi:hypothetical protein